MEDREAILAEIRAELASGEGRARPRKARAVAEVRPRATPPRAPVRPRLEPASPYADRAERAPTFVEFVTQYLKDGGGRPLTFTPAQIAFVSVAYDGADPVDLSDEPVGGHTPPVTLRALALSIFGGAERIPRKARRIVVARFGRGSAKTLLSAARGIWRMAYADLSRCGPGDVARVIVASPRKGDQSNIALQVARTFAEQVAGRLGWEFVSDSATSFVILRRDGREVEFTTVAKSRGGDAARGFSIVDAIIDESEFVSPSDPSSQITDGQIVSAIMPRLLPGGCVSLISTPWPAQSTTSDLFEKNFGQPSNALVAFGPTALMRCWTDPAREDLCAQYVETLELIESERERDPGEALREFDCVCSAVGGMYFNTSDIERAVDRGIVVTKNRATGGLDLGYRNDSSGAVAGERQAAVAPMDGLRFVVTLCSLVAPLPGIPLEPSMVIRGFAIELLNVGCPMVVADQHEFTSAQEHGRNNGIRVMPGYGPTEREKAFAHLRDLFREGRVSIPDNPALVRQLKSVMSRPQIGGGLQIVLPRGRGTGHADLVSALVQAAWLDRRNGPLAVARMGAVRRVGERVRMAVEGGLNAAGGMFR